MIINQHKNLTLLGTLVYLTLLCNTVEGMQNGIMFPNTSKVTNKTEPIVPQAIQVQPIRAQMLPYQIDRQIDGQLTHSQNASLPLSTGPQNIHQTDISQTQLPIQIPSAGQIPSSEQHFVNNQLQDASSSKIIGQLQTTNQPQIINQFQTGEQLQNINQLQNTGQFQSTKQYQHITGKRTCLEALQSSTSGGIYQNYCILDLSNTSDFTQNADFVTQQFFIQVQTAKIKCIYMDLYNSFVDDAYINRWNTQFKQAGMQVLWNLSGNKTVTDQTITILGGLENVIGLNLAGTAITDMGVYQLISMLNGNNPIDIDFINIYKCQISDTSRIMLENKFNENSSRWNTIYPDKKTNRRGIISNVGLGLSNRLNYFATPTSVQVAAPISNTSNIGLSTPIVSGSGLSTVTDNKQQRLVQYLPQVTGTGTQNYSSTIQNRPIYSPINTEQNFYNNQKDIGNNINSQYYSR